jgi:hypothetical protein
VQSQNLTTGSAQHYHPACLWILLSSIDSTFVEMVLNYIPRHEHCPLDRITKPVIVLMLITCK